MSSGYLPKRLSHHNDSNSFGFIIRSGALYFGPGLETAAHALHCYKIYVATYGDFDLHLAGGRVVNSCQAVIIAPDRLHRITSRCARLCVFYLVPETAEGRKLSEFFPGREVFSPPPRVLSALMPNLQTYMENGCTADEAADVSSYFFDNLTPVTGADRGVDPRVRHVLEYLSSRVNRRVTIKEIGIEVSLSASRIEHLFREQVGIPISRYLLWARVRASLQLMTVDSSLTRVALEAGFYDSAHFSRTFRQMIGVAPSTLLRTTHLYKIEPEAGRGGRLLARAGH